MYKMTRSTLEVAIVATELYHLMARIRRCDTPQLRALLGEVQKRNGGDIKMDYGSMRQLIVQIGELFAVRRKDDEPVTPEPRKAEPLSEVAQARAMADFRG